MKDLHILAHEAERRKATQRASAAWPLDTRGKPIDHIAFSTTNLTAERDRIKAAGVEIAEDMSLSPNTASRACS